MAGEVTVDPRYMKYNKKEVETLLDRVANPASEESVRHIVSGYGTDDGQSNGEQSEET